MNHTVRKLIVLTVLFALTNWLYQESESEESNSVVETYVCKNYNMVTNECLVWKKKDLR